MKSIAAGCWAANLQAGWFLERLCQRLVALKQRADAAAEQAAAVGCQTVQQVVVAVAVEGCVAHADGSIHRPPEAIQLVKCACQFWRRVDTVQHLAHLQKGGRTVCAVRERMSRGGRMLSHYVQNPPQCAAPAPPFHHHHPAPSHPAVEANES